MGHLVNCEGFLDRGVADKCHPIVIEMSSETTAFDRLDLSHATYLLAPPRQLGDSEGGQEGTGNFCTLVRDTNKRSPVRL